MLKDKIKARLFDFVMFSYKTFYPNHRPMIMIFDKLKKVVGINAAPENGVLAGMRVEDIEALKEFSKRQGIALKSLEARKKSLEATIHALQSDIATLEQRNKKSKS